MHTETAKGALERVWSLPAAVMLRRARVTVGGCNPHEGPAAASIIGSLAFSARAGS